MLGQYGPRTDEIFLMIIGNRRYMFAMLDTDTRYWLAKMVLERKGTPRRTSTYRVGAWPKLTSGSLW